MIPRYGTPPHPGRRYRLRPGAYALLVRGGQALLTLQSVPEPDLQLPGGGIDPGESQIAALHREVYEETGWAIAGARRLGAYRRFAYLPEYGFWAEKLCHIWLARPVLPRCPPVEPHHAPVWFPLDRVVAAITEPGARAFLARRLGPGRTGHSGRI